MSSDCIHSKKYRRTYIGLGTEKPVDICCKCGRLRKEGKINWRKPRVEASHIDTCHADALWDSCHGPTETLMFAAPLGQDDFNGALELLESIDDDSLATKGFPDEVCDGEILAAIVAESRYIDWEPYDEDGNPVSIYSVREYIEDCDTPYNYVRLSWGKKDD